MANEEQVKILMQGAKVWNKWREENPNVRPDLSGANLHGASLRGASLRGASLGVANLSGANLKEIIAGYTSFSNLDLSQANDLETVSHRSPSSKNSRA